MSSGSEYGNLRRTRDDWIHARSLTGFCVAGFSTATMILLICWFLPLVKERQRQQVALQNFETAGGTGASDLQQAKRN